MTQCHCSIPYTAKDIQTNSVCRGFTLIASFRGGKLTHRHLTIRSMCRPQTPSELLLEIAANCQCYLRSKSVGDGVIQFLFQLNPDIRMTTRHNMLSISLGEMLQYYFLKIKELKYRKGKP